MTFGHCFVARVQSCAKCNEKDLTSKQNFTHFLPPNMPRAVSVKKDSLNLSLDLRKLFCANRLLTRRGLRSCERNKAPMQLLCNWRVKSSHHSQAIKTCINIATAALLNSEEIPRTNYFNYAPQKCEKFMLHSKNQINKLFALPSAAETETTNYEFLTDGTEFSISRETAKATTKENATSREGSIESWVC